MEQSHRVVSRMGQIIGGVEFVQYIFFQTLAGIDCNQFGH